MKNIITIVSIFSLIALSSCTSDFEEINTNPNSPNSVQPSLLLRQVIYDYGEQMSYEGFVAGDLLSQHRTAVDFNLFDRHALKSPQLGGNPWPIFYSNLRDNEIIIKQSQTVETFAVYEGPALIMKAYMAGVLTDLFGDVPYSEAFNGIEGTVTPVYDAQEDIYNAENGILDNLDKGIAAINAYQGAIPLEGDILFSGDLQGWVRFANSLKIKHLMRASGQINVSAQLQSIVDSGNYIDGNDKNAIFNFTSTEPNSFRLAQLRIGDFNNFVLSETMEDIMTTLNDPRIEVLFRPFSNSTSGEFNGLINGIDATQTTVVLADYSLAGTLFREDTSGLDANFSTAWETNFFLAEAAERGFITGNAQQFYNTAVEQAFDYWLTDLPVDYLTTGDAAYGSTGNNIEQILTQKWIGNVINGYEGWTEWRRTGFPEFRQIQGSLNDNIIPVRMPYPSEEEALNAENYNAAAQATNDNSINANVWWNQ